MAAPWDPFLDCRSEAALTAAGCSAARRCAAHDRAHGTIVPANDDEAKDLFYDWIGAIARRCARELDVASLARAQTALRRLKAFGPHEASATLVGQIEEFARLHLGDVPGMTWRKRRSSNVLLSSTGQQMAVVIIADGTYTWRTWGPCGRSFSDRPSVAGSSATLVAARVDVAATLASHGWG